MKTLSVYQMESVSGGKASAMDWACNLSLGTAGLIWTTAASIASAGAGVIVGAAWLVFQTWLCGEAEDEEK